MELTLEESEGTYKIQSYDNGCLTINGEKYSDSLIVMPEKLITPWGPNSITELSAKDFEIFLFYKLEVVLIGTGDKLKRPDLAVLSPIINANIGFEIMDTKAACRTYMLLMADGRHVAAGLLV